MEADPERAVALKRENPGFILVGEINEVPIEGADLGNSPTHIIQKGASYFRNKTVIHRTTAGVTGATAAFKKADEVVLGELCDGKGHCRVYRETETGSGYLGGHGRAGRETGPRR